MKNRKRKIDEGTLELIGVFILNILVIIFLIVYYNQDNGAEVESSTNDVVEESIEVDIIIPTLVPTLTPTPEPTTTSTPTLTITPTSTPTPTPNPREAGEKIYDIKMPAEHQWYLYDICKDNEVSFELAISTVWRESMFNSACSNKNDNGTTDAGYFQINECNWEKYGEMFPEWDPYDPYDNMNAGVVHIKKCMQYDENPRVFMMAYNMGYSGAKKHWNKGVWSSSYSRSLVNYMNDILPTLLLVECYSEY